jgi:hypothetical protein
MKVCPHCNGVGEVLSPSLIRTADGDLETKMAMIECYWCLGTGDNHGD